MKRDEIIEIYFIATKPSSPRMRYSDLLRKLKLNGHEICDNTVESTDSSCAQHEVIDGPKAGRFDGLLTISPKYSTDVPQVIIEVDNPALALGVSRESQLTILIYDFRAFSTV